MQNSAISLSICVDNDKHKIPQLIEDLKVFFEVLCDDNLSLFTLRHYTKQSVEQFLHDKNVVLEQRSCNTLQLIAR